MRIVELFEQSPVGTTGSTTGMTQPVSQVQPVSQNPSTNNKQEKTDPKIQQMAALLKQNNVISNEKEINDFLGAYTASTTNKTLNPAQQDVLSKLTGPLMKDPSLAAKLKMLAAVKPGQQNTTQQPGQQPTQQNPLAK